MEDQFTTTAHTLPDSTSGTFVSTDNHYKLGYNISPASKADAIVTSVNLDGQQRLRNRGILGAALVAGWRCDESQQRWFYNVIDPITGTESTRSKAYDSATKSKYLWHSPDGKPTGLNYYAPQGGDRLRAAIAAAGGELLIVNGEPAVLTILAAGHENVLCWFGELSVPQTLVADLRALRVQRVRFITDKDAAGQQAATKVRNRLLNSDIEYTALRLPDDLVEHADVNDLWIEIGFNPAALWATLDSCPALDLPAPEPQQDTMRETFRQGEVVDYSPAWAEFFEQLNRAVELTFNIQGYKKNNWSKPFANHWRGETHPSANYNRISHTLKDFGGDTLNYKQLAAQLGIELPATPKHQRSNQRAAAPEPEPTPQPNTPVFFPQGVPDGVRSTFLNYTHPSTAPTVEVIITGANAGLLDSNRFTVADLHTANDTLGLGVSKGTLLRGLTSLCEMELITKIPIEENTAMGKFVINSRGRQAAVYCLCSKEHLQQQLERYAAPRIVERAYPAGDGGTLVKFAPGILESIGFSREAAEALSPEVNAHFEPIYEQQEKERSIASKKRQRARNRLDSWLTDTRSTPLPQGWKIANGRDYKAAFLHAIEKDNPGERRSRREVAELVGVSTRNVKTVEAHANLKSVHQFERVSVRPTAPLAVQVRNGASKVRGYPKRLISTRTDGQAVPMDYNPNNPDAYTKFVETELKSGGKVEIEYQVANAREIISYEQPERPERPPVERKPAEGRVITMPAPESQPRQYFGTKFDPAWIYAQLVMALKYLTGELLPPDTDVYTLLSAVLGRPVHADPLVQDALELGAVIVEGV